jgi:hypothetical protein
MSRDISALPRENSRTRRIVVTAAVIAIAVAAVTGVYLSGILSPKPPPLAPITVFNQSGPFGQFELAGWYIQKVTGLATSEWQGFSTSTEYRLQGGWSSVNETSMFLLTNAQYGAFFQTVWAYHPSGYTYGVINQTSDNFNVTLQANDYYLVFMDLTSSNATVSISPSIIANPA